MGVSTIVGMGTGIMIATGVSSSPVTGGYGLFLIPIAIGIDAAAAKGVEYIQNKIYDVLDIK